MIKIVMRQNAEKWRIDSSQQLADIFIPAKTIFIHLKGKPGVSFIPFY
jgi:hypothetical protein